MTVPSKTTRQNEKLTWRISSLSFIQINSVQIILVCILPFYTFPSFQVVSFPVNGLKNNKIWLLKEVVKYNKTVLLLLRKITISFL